MPSRESNSGLPYSKPTRYQLSHAAFGGTKPLFIIFLHYLHSYTFIHTQSLSSSPVSSSLQAQVEGRHWGAEPRFELGAALQQPDTLPTAPCRTLLRHAAPYCAMPHPPAPCRTLLRHAAPYCAMPHPWNFNTVRQANIFHTVKRN